MVFTQPNSLAILLPTLAMGAWGLWNTLRSYRLRALQTELEPEQAARDKAQARCRA
jgi:hypothetical protein